MIDVDAERKQFEEAADHHGYRLGRTEAGYTNLNTGMLWRGWLYKARKVDDMKKFKVLITSTLNSEHPQIATLVVEFDSKEEAIDAAEEINKAEPIDGRYTQSAQPLFKWTS